MRVSPLAVFVVLSGVCCAVPPPPRRPDVLVIGHRGSPGEAPENTLASVAAGFARGCDLVEVDVRSSRDRVPVIMHDDTVDRTTTGHGAVADLTLAELKRLDAGSWKDARFAGERVPTLAEALQESRGKGRLLLDVPVAGMGAMIAEVFRSLRLPSSSVVLGTWDPAQRSDFRTFLPGGMILLSEGAPDRWDADYFERQKTSGVDVFEIPNWSPAFIAAAHAHKMPVYVYTVNDEPTIRRLLDAGVDGIETDDPALAIGLVRQMRR